MSELDLLLRIIPNPLLLIPILMVGWFFLSPVKAVVGRRIEAGLERTIVAFNTSNLFDRIVIFVVVVASATGLIASVWTYFSTDLPPPLIDPNFQHPMGPFVTRLHGYSIIWACSFIPVLGYVAGANVIGTNRRDFFDLFGSFVRRLPFAVFLGLAPTLLWVGYAALFDRSHAYNHPLPAPDLDLMLWWYSWVPLVSVGWGIIAYAGYLSLRGLWRLTAHVA